MKEIVDMFNVANCPSEVKKLWAQGGASLDNEFVVAHCIEPNFAVSQRGSDEEVSIVPGVFEYREIYWLKGIKTAQPLSVRGFHMKPFMAARWSTVSNDAYGRSPCMDALGDNKQIQLETRRKAEFIDKGVRPPMGANVELKNEPSSIISGMITYMSTEGGKKGFWPLFEPQAQWLQGITADIDKVSARIERCLFVDVFMAITRMEGVQPRNELELTKRDLERLQQLGPFITLFENEFGNPFFERLLDIMRRRKILRPLPDSLKNVPLKIRYTSIMRLAQQSAEAVGMKDFFGTMGGLSSAAKAAGVPDPLRIVNLDKSARRFSDVTNFPVDCLYTDKEVTQHDQIRAKGDAAGADAGAGHGGGAGGQNPERYQRRRQQQSAEPVDGRSGRRRFPGHDENGHWNFTTCGVLLRGRQRRRNKNGMFYTRVARASSDLLRCPRRGLCNPKAGNPACLGRPAADYRAGHQYNPVGDHLHHHHLYRVCAYKLPVEFRRRRP